MDFKKVRTFIDPLDHEHVNRDLKKLEPFFKTSFDKIAYNLITEDLPTERILLICCLDNFFILCRDHKPKLMEFLKHNKMLLVNDYDIELYWRWIKLKTNDDFKYANLHRISDSPDADADIITGSRFIISLDVNGINLLNNQPKQGNFFSLIGNNRSHRDILLNSLYNKDLLSKGKVVYHGCENDAIRPLLYHQAKWADLKDFNFPIHHSFMHMQISRDYLDFNLELVSETMVDYVYLTEKSLRPLSAGMPFIMLAGTNQLKYLQNLGFETYHKYLDESYDSELSTEKRVDKITDILVRMDDKDFVNVYSKTRDIAAHNLENAFKSNLRYSNSFVEKIYTWIKEL